MPRGAYLLSGHDGPYAVERFSCARGPAGWRYTARREQPGTGASLGDLDVTLDAAGRAVRVQVRAAGWELLGGVVGDQVTWRRGHVEQTERAAGITGTSPVWLLAAAWLLRPSRPVQVRLVQLGDEALAVHTVTQAWQPAQSTTYDGIDVSSYAVSDLQTGRQRLVHITGDVVVAAQGVVLRELEGVPNR